ncbi:MAG: GNAT family N-acetyltransferase [Trueperaceae bacterium]|nr:MAG: GNAT family N-acetyltransferase [Trueperaceae bacterium]
MSRAEKRTIRRCTPADFGAILEIINDGAQAYRGVIPEDRWHEPYMSARELEQEIAAGVVFWGYQQLLLGVMGIQDKGDVTLIRHAYVRTEAQGRGVGTALLKQLEVMTHTPILIGTWAAATWAIAFYQKNGYSLIPEAEKTALLHTYWSIPERQVETSVVLASRAWSRLRTQR